MVEGTAVDDADGAPADLAVGPLLRGHTVILTGAAGGIGRRTARFLARAGARLAVTDLTAAPLDALVDDLRATGAEALGEAFDAADPARFRAFHERVVARFGPVDGLVNCAGLWRTGSFLDLDEDAWRTMLAANLETAYAGCHAVLPDMVARRRGSVVNFASTSGEYGSVSPAAHYAAAKGGVIALTKSLAREVGPHQVRVNAVSPGPIDTTALGAGAPVDKAAVGSRTLFGRLGAPYEIAAACAYLLSPLSTFVTGHVLRVNGGSLL